MTVDAEFTLKIKMKDLVFPNNITGIEMKQRLLEEGEKRMRYVSSGYLLDPENKVISKDITFEIKQH